MRRSKRSPDDSGAVRRRPRATRAGARAAAAAMLFLFIAGSTSAVVVNFEDQYLEAAVREAIRKPTGDILDTDLVGAGFTHLDAPSRLITSLEGIEYCTDLTDVRLRFNSIRDLSPVAGLTNLTTLMVAYNKISDLGPLAGLPNLTYLYLDQNQISDLSPLAGLINLTHLGLSKNRISNVSPLAGLGSLTELDLSGNLISELRILVGLSNLTVLHLDDNRISDIGPLTYNFALAGGDAVTLTVNPLSQAALCRDIPVLVRRGASVTYDPGCGLDADGDDLTDGYETTVTLTDPNNRDTDGDGASDRDEFVAGTDPLDGHDFPGVFAVWFPDPILESGVRRAIHRPTGDIRNSDLVGVGFTHLEVHGYYVAFNEFQYYFYGISSLTGLEFCTDLINVNLGRNFISDLSPLAGLTNLTNLDLGGNRISDVGPVVGLTNLTNLDLGSNQASDLSPLADLTNLTELDLSYNEITDLSPLAGLTNLTILDLSPNQIGDLSPLVGLPELTQLFLHDNQITDVGPLAGLTNLTQLSLHDNQITDLSPLAGLTNLTQLSLHDNQISDLSGLAGLTGFTEFDLSHNAISDLSPLAGLTGLTKLNLTYNDITDLSPLAGLVSLTELQLHHNQVSDTSPLASLVNLVNLTKFSLYNNQITDLSGLAGFTNLTYLYLQNNQISDLSPLAGLTNLTHIYLYNNQISDLSPLAGLSNLITLYLYDNQISDLSPLAGLKKLRGLYLNNNRVADLGPLATLTSLITLELENNRISDLSPLVANSGFGPRDPRKPKETVKLAFNPLSPSARCVDIPRLKERGVSVTGSDGCVVDADDDGLTAAYEMHIGTDPYNPDTDGDGAWDRDEAIFGTDPLDNQDLPTVRIVVFPDPGLDAAVRDAIGKPNGYIYDTELVGVGFTFLDASSRLVFSLAGLEYCTDLSDLDLSDNQVHDLSPLAGLVNLAWLNLSDNWIDDISALVDNFGIGAGDEVMLALNPLSQTALCQDIPDLMARGASVIYTGACGADTDGDGLPDEYETLIGTDPNNPDTDGDSVGDRDEVLTGTDPLNPGVRRVVDFPDVRLQAVVRIHIGKPTGYIYDTDLVGVGFTSLAAGGVGIRSLVGLEYCTDLTVLYLYSNQISDLDQLAGLTNLTKLSLPDNQISDLGPLAGLTNLTYLNLHNNQISDLNPLAGLTNLTELYLYNNQVSDLSPLAGLTNLNRLDLSNNQIGDLSPLAGLTNLNKLYLYNNQISDLSPLAGLSSLDDLDLSENQISDLSPLAGLTGLHRLYLRNNWITDIHPLRSSGLAELDFLYLAGNPLSQSALCNDMKYWRARIYGGGRLDYTGACEADADGDDLADEYETSFSLTDPDNPDTDGDLAWDRDEVLLGTDPLDSSDFPLSQVIDFPDPGLEATVREAIGKPTGDIERGELVGTGFTFLDASNRDIVLLDGLEYCTGLTEIYLFDNQFRDISPLVANWGLGAGSMVDLDANPLSTTAVCQDIPTLEARGVTVLYGGVCGGTIYGAVSDTATGERLTCSTVVARPDDGVASVALADRHGKYLLQGLAPGLYTVEACAPGYDTRTARAPVVGSERLKVDFPLDAVSSGTGVSGMVLDDATGLPLGGVRVKAWFGDLVGGMSYTCADGFYEITGLVAKATLYTLQFSAEGYETETQVVMVSEGEVTQADQALTATFIPGMLSGVVFKAYTHEPIAGAQVQGVLTGVGHSTLTDQDGTYLFPSLGPGHYLLRTSAPGYRSDARIATLPEGEEKQVDIRLTHPADVDGQAGVTPVDVQLVINAALGTYSTDECDIDADGKVTAIDVQLVIIAALDIS